MTLLHLVLSRAFRMGQTGSLAMTEGMVFSQPQH